MSGDVLDFLLRCMKVDQYTSRAVLPPAEPQPVVTLARDHGAGGEAVAARVAEALGVRCFDKEILDAVVGTAKADPDVMRVLDETVPQRPGTFLFTRLLGIDDPLPEYQQLLARVVNGIAQRGGVIVGRGAHLLLRGSLRFRVRIVGSDELCARRLAGEGADTAAALEEVRRVNAARADYLREVFRVEPDDPRQYDLIVNTDRFADLGEVAAFVVQAYRAHTR